MYELRVESDFRAIHAVTMGGRPESAHDHTWHVTGVVAGPALDAEGLLCDFHVVERQLERVLTPLRDCDLNETPPFDHVNPSAGSPDTSPTRSGREFPRACPSPPSA
jgi:6-pyruvoyl-tetrahydropterin synthase